MHHIQGESNHPNLLPSTGLLRPLLCQACLPTSMHTFSALSKLYSSRASLSTGGPLFQGPEGLSKRRLSQGKVGLIQTTLVTLLSTSDYSRQFVFNHQVTPP